VVKNAVGIFQGSFEHTRPVRNFYIMPLLQLRPTFVLFADLKNGIKKGHSEQTEQ
jgi:uncharacterized membrane protein (GlpM family)